MKSYYCWRCKIDMPFLNEEEWAEISPLLYRGVQAIANYQREHQCNIETARVHTLSSASEVMKKFEELTGMSDIHADIIWHHRLSEWGKECKCGGLLRTPKALFCSQCGCHVG